MVEEYINFIANQATPIAIGLEEIKEETRKDSELKCVIKALKSDQWNELDSSYQTYYMLKEELCTTTDGDLLLRGNRIIMPNSLRNRAIDLAHEGHQGIVKCKQLLRTKIWFPKIDQMVKEKIANCIPCQASTYRPQQEPLKMSPTPEKVWQEVSADFYGPLPSGEYLLVMVDGYSRYPYVEIVHSTSINSAFPAFDKAFSMLGIPEILKTDNGPPFNGNKFTDFAKHFGFHHTKITPL